MPIRHSLPTIDSSDVKAVAEVIKSRNLAQGQVVKAFEEKLARFVGVRGAVAVSNGSTAIYLALLSLGVKKGDEVIAPSYVCLALLNAINMAGAKAVLCEVNQNDFNIDPKDIAKKITKKTKAIVVPHMFGRSADIGTIKKFNIPIIEDCAHSIGAVYEGKKVGSFGVASIFSFYATKMITAGEGGMVASNSESFLKKIREMRDYDKKEKLNFYFNYKMTDMQAALGLNQLNRLPYFIRQRKKLASLYAKYLKGCPIILPGNNKSIFYRYIIVLNKAAGPIIAKLKKAGINCDKPVFKPLHFYLHQSGFSLTERLWQNSISLPIYPSLKESEVKKVSFLLKKILLDDSR